MLKYGNICDIDYTKGLARVNYDDLGIVSGWLSLPTVSTKGTKYFVPLEINSQVAVLMHKDGEQGEIIKSVWSKKDIPPSWGGANKQGIEFSDGTIIHYDTSSHKLTVSISSGTIEINGGTLGGMVKVESILSAINRLEDKMKTHQHIAIALGTPTSIDPATNSTFSNTEKSDIENDKIKQ